MDDSLTNHLGQLTQQLGSLDQRYIWVSMIWGAIAGGYCIYGFKQKEIIPCLGGFAMTAATFLIFSALWLSVISIAIMFAIWWLCKQGY
jgi:uncharacterized membrane protein YoaK (UPF0700 family)